MRGGATGLRDATDIMNAWDRAQGRRSAYRARVGVWGPLLSRLRAGASLSEEERAVLIDLFEGKLVATKVKIDKRRVPDPEIERREIDTINFLLNQMEQGRSISEAVRDALEAFDLGSDAPIWKLIKDNRLVFSMNFPALGGEDWSF